MESYEGPRTPAKPLLAFLPPLKSPANPASRSALPQLYKAAAGDPRTNQRMFGFRRRNDTMYLVSLTDNHLILPALNTSKDKPVRTKVAFIMPAAFGLNGEFGHFDIRQVKS